MALLCASLFARRVGESGGGVRRLLGSPMRRAHQLPIAAPCQADWSAMRGDERRRHCELCSLHVRDVTDATDAEVLALQQEMQTQRVCIRRPLEATELVTSRVPGRWLAAGLFALSLAACTGHGAGQVEPAEAAVGEDALLTTRPDALPLIDPAPAEEGCVGEVAGGVVGGGLGAVMGGAVAHTTGRIVVPPRARSRDASVTPVKVSLAHARPDRAKTRRALAKARRSLRRKAATQRRAQRQAQRRTTEAARHSRVAARIARRGARDARRMARHQRMAARRAARRLQRIARRGRRLAARQRRRGET